MRTKLLQNKTMNNETYALRRKVIQIIYELKSIVDLPRINVRITESDPHILGVGRYGTCQIWITEDCINMGRNVLRHVVVHEIGHAVFSLPHNDTCVVMKPLVSERTAASQNEIIEFLKKNTKVSA